ncbi:hypothetical protein KDK_65120 [Dictyobacter kobayashii]|uniref:Uncharacterized protein n=1 Tax=Dictyobacter kobayashii TaxID=2014872 RepID=A0A402AUB8_9CHLR|nr:hypothetical protein KDK_65120 [Dictyobacter kobayashii]
MQVDNLDRVECPPEGYKDLSAHTSHQDSVAQTADKFQAVDKVQTADKVTAGYKAIVAYNQARYYHR